MMQCAAGCLRRLVHPAARASLSRPALLSHVRPRAAAARRGMRTAAAPGPLLRSPSHPPSPWRHSHSTRDADPAHTHCPGSTGSTHSARAHTRSGDFFQATPCRLLSAADVRRKRWLKRLAWLAGAAAVGTAVAWLPLGESDTDEPAQDAAGSLSHTDSLLNRLWQAIHGNSGAQRTLLPPAAQSEGRSPAAAADKAKDENDMSMEVARLILFAKRAVENHENATAAEALETALRKAKADGLSHRTTVGIRDRLANVYLVTRDYDRAIVNFRAVLEELLLDAGSSATFAPPAAIEISLKMSACFSAQGKDKAADAGYRWCEQQAALAAKSASGASGTEAAEAVALSGLVQEEYALFLRSLGRHQEAHAKFLAAAAIAESLAGEGDDYSVAQARAYYYASIESEDVGQRELAQKEAERAVELCRSQSCSHLANFENQLRDLQRSVAARGA